MAATDAEELERKALSYFSRTNYLNKCIASQEKTIIKYLGNRWSELPLQHKENLLDLLFVDDETRRIYHVDSENIKSPDDDADIQESFPRLFINSGQKINVDFENDLWTWRDEHSGPFSWMSRSQQDLTLADLEPDTISKPQPKSSKLDAEEEGNVKKAKPQFTYPSSSWFHDIIDDFKKNEQDIILTPSTSMNLTTARGEGCLEEVNPGFEGSCDDLSRESSPARELTPKPATDETDSQPASDKKQKGKDKGRRSPSPKKILRSGSFKKSPGKNPDHGGQKLIGEDDAEVGDDTNVFSNPVMESEWSTFVGDHGDVTASNTGQTSFVTGAPEAMTMDRGENIVSSSPYQGDSVRLLDSNVQASPYSGTVASPARSDVSYQSTPDHTTHLLKGMQSPVHKMYHQDNTKLNHASATCASGMTTEQSQTTTPGKGIPDALETEEVLIADGDKIVMIPQEQSNRDSDIPMTGFDFLDNW